MKKFIAAVVLPAFALTGCFTDDKPVIPATSCAIDAPTKGAVAPLGQPMVVSGWAYDKIGNNRIAPEVKVQITSVTRDMSKTFEAKSMKRPDLVRGFNDPRLEDAGFTVEVPANSVNPGVYEVTILQKFGNSMVACGAEHTIEIK